MRPSCTKDATKNQIEERKAGNCLIDINLRKAQSLEQLIGQNQQDGILEHLRELHHEPTWREQLKEQRRN